MDKTMKLWERASGNLIKTLENSDEVISASFSPDSNLIIIQTTDKTVKLYERVTGSLLFTFNPESTIPLHLQVFV